MRRKGLRVLSLLVLSASALAAVPNRPDRTHIVFGYMQATAPDGPLTAYRWHALTHVGYTFVAFAADGGIDPESRQRFRNRSPELKPGGAAANNGVRVIAVLNNRGFKVEPIDAVFPSAERRARLVGDVVALVTDPQAGCDGISLDIEPMKFKPATAEGYNRFVAELGAALHALKPRRELSMYVGGYHAGRYQLNTFREHLDYLLFSAYNFAAGDTVGDVGLVQSTHKGIDSWLKAGFPAGRIVLTLALFGKQWDTSKAAWGATGTRSRSIGMDYGNYLVSTRRPPLRANSPGAATACVWSAEPLGDGRRFRVATFDDPSAHLRKLRMALHWDGEVGQGSSLGGVGFWSLMWLAQGLQPGSVDPNDPAAHPDPAWRRTYSLPWTLWEETFAPAAQKIYRAATFEGLALDPRWTASPSGPDALKAGDGCAITAAPAEPGGPSASHRVASLRFEFRAAPGRVLCKYRPLADVNPPHPLDRNSLLVLTEARAEFRVPLFVAAAQPSCALRLVVLDARNELERSTAFSLATPGWQTLRWAMSDPATVSAYSTHEGGCRSGNGKIDTAGPGVRDVALLGFELEATAPASGRVDLDQILYSRGPSAAP
jgi:hypothetical protein